MTRLWTLASLACFLAPSKAGNNKISVESWDNDDCSGPVNKSSSSESSDLCVLYPPSWWNPYGYSVFITCTSDSQLERWFYPYGYCDWFYPAGGFIYQTGQCIKADVPGHPEAVGSMKVTCTDDPCFGAADTHACRVTDATLSAAAAYAACFSSDGVGAERVLMSSLTAGDIVLSEADGAPAKTSVVVNQHAAEAKSSALLNIRHELGSLSLTADHVLHLNGRFVPAREAKAGDLLSDATLGAVKVESVAASRGPIINPITADGKVLAAGSSGAPVLAATANEWLADTLLSSYPQYTLSFALAAAFPQTAQAFYDAALEPFFTAAAPHLKAAKAAWFASAPLVAAAFVLGDVLLAGGVGLFALGSLKMVLAVAAVGTFAAARRVKA